MPMRKLGLIAGNGQLPFEVLRRAGPEGVELAVAAIKEETDPAIEQVAVQSQSRVAVEWLGVGQLGRLLKFFRREGVEQAVLAGQVRHVRIFAPGSPSALRQLKHLPDLRMLRLLASLPHKNTSALIEGVIAELEKEGIEVLPSTLFLDHLMARPGVLTRRQPSGEEQKDIEYGRPIARQLALLDLGQTIVVKHQAVVAVEAMEGTDETIRRASRLVGGQALTVIKVSRPNQDLRYDVPVIGLNTLEVLRECHVSALAIDSGKTVILDRERFLQEADRAGLTVVA